LRYSSSRTTLSSELQPSSMILPYFYSIDISRLFIVSLTHLTCMKLDWLYSLLPCLIWIWRYLEHHERNPDLDRSETLGQFVSSHGYSKLFQDAYLVRLLSALLYVCTPARALFLLIVIELWKKNIYICCRFQCVRASGPVRHKGCWASRLSLRSRIAVTITFLRCLIHHFVFLVLIHRA
jgi:hypothetical protein